MAAYTVNGRTSTAHVHVRLNDNTGLRSSVKARHSVYQQHTVFKVPRLLTSNLIIVKLLQLWIAETRRASTITLWPLSWMAPRWATQDDTCVTQGMPSQGTLCWKIIRAKNTPMKWIWWRLQLGAGMGQKENAKVSICAIIYLGFYAEYVQINSADYTTGAQVFPSLSEFIWILVILYLI